jgi:hypothetical protein
MLSCVAICGTDWASCRNNRTCAAVGCCTSCAVAEIVTLSSAAVAVVAAGAAAFGCTGAIAAAAPPDAAVPTIAVVMFHYLPEACRSYVGSIGPRSRNLSKAPRNPPAHIRVPARYWHLGGVPTIWRGK